MKKGDTLLFYWIYSLRRLDVEGEYTRTCSIRGESVDLRGTRIDSCYKRKNVI